MTQYTCKHTWNTSVNIIITNAFQKRIMLLCKITGWRDELQFCSITWVDHIKCLAILYRKLNKHGIKYDYILKAFV